MKNGVITPVASVTENRVYLKSGFTHQVDIRTPGGDFDHLYPAGIGSYVPGQTVVKGSDGKLYACRPFPQRRVVHHQHRCLCPGRWLRLAGCLAAVLRPP